MKVCFKKLFFSILFLGCILSFCSLSYALEADKEEVLESTPKLSIVVPVYNVAAYLDEALDSVENQTYKDLEIICVNDGSTDNSLEILENHAKKDNRIKIINQENQGAGEARNVGLRLSTGKYIYFFDSDDLLAPYAMEKSINLLEKYDADMLTFDFIRYRYDSKIDLSKFFYKDLPIRVCNFREGQNPFEIFRTRTVAVWSYVYKKSFLMDNKIEFKKGLNFFEDNLFTYLCKARLKRLVSDSNIGYFYRSGRPKSLTAKNSKVNVDRVDRFLTMVRELVLSKDKFRFYGSNEYLLEKMLEIAYYDIGRINNQKEKKFCARKAYEEIGKNFAEKYNVSLSRNYKKKLDALKSWGGVLKNNHKRNQVRKANNRSQKTKNKSKNILKSA